MAPIVRGHFFVKRFQADVGLIVCDELRTPRVLNRLAALASESHNTARQVPVRRIAQ